MIDLIVLTSCSITDSIFIKFTLHSGIGRLAIIGQIPESGSEKISVKMTDYSRMRGYMVCEMNISNKCGNIHIRETIPIETYNKIRHTTDNMELVQVLGKYIIQCVIVAHRIY